jgi:2-dehydropantoate 2-reductase
VTEPVRVAILGCGAIGSLYAAHLARVPGVEVWAVDPWAAHVEAIESEGLRVTGFAEFVAPVHARSDAAELPECALAVVATKAMHTRDAVIAARHAVGNAAVASVQNGLGNEESIAEIVPRVIRGSIVTAGHVSAPGVVSYDAPGDTWLGPFEPSPARDAEISLLARLLNAGGLRTFALDDVRGPQWTKVVFNAATSPLAALTGLTVGQVCTHPLLREQVDRLVAEALEVCRVSGIALLRNPAESVQEAIDEAFWHKPSMLADVLSQRLTEVDVLNGGISAEGRRIGVATPGHDAMVALLHGLESSWAGQQDRPARHVDAQPDS